MEEAEENIEEGKAWRQREGRREKAGDQGGREGVKGGGVGEEGLGYNLKEVWT